MCKQAVLHSNLSKTRDIGIQWDGQWKKSVPSSGCDMFERKMKHKRKQRRDASYFQRLLRLLSLIAGKIHCHIHTHLQVLASYPVRCCGQQCHNSACNTCVSCVTSFTLVSSPYRDPNALLPLPQVHTNLSSERFSPAFVFFRNNLLPPSANKAVPTEWAVNKLLTTFEKYESFWIQDQNPRSQTEISNAWAGEGSTFISPLVSTPQKSFPLSVIHFRGY